MNNDCNHYHIMIIAGSRAALFGRLVNNHKYHNCHNHNIMAYVYIYIYIYNDNNNNNNVCVYIYIYIYTHTCVCIYIYIYTHVYGAYGANTVGIKNKI